MKTLVVGCRGTIDGTTQSDHITGCALYHPNIAKLMPKLTSCTGMAWDYRYRAEIIQVGGHTHMIENFYNSKDFKDDIVNRADLGVRIHHGCKDRSVVEAVAKKYSIKLS